MKVAINGFGRIGRLALREIMGRDGMEVVAINDTSPVETLAHLFKHDTSYGNFDGEVKIDTDYMIVNGKKIHTSAQRDPSVLPWKDLGIDVVLECTGVFRTVETAMQHVTAGAKRVVISAPCKEDTDCGFVVGVNHTNFDPTKHEVLSTSSCTTNCITPVAKVLHDTFKITRGFMTTVHSYTNDQRVQDSSHKDLRRARAAAMNMIPTTTGAAKSLGLMIPDLQGKIDGIAIRVPVATASLIDLIVEVEKPTTIEEVNGAFKAASEGDLKGILGYSEEPLVSSDYISDRHSGTVDALSTDVMEGTMLKILAWYDNEFGYAVRLVDMAEYAGKECGYM